MQNNKDADQFVHPPSPDKYRAYLLLRQCDTYSCCIKNYKTPISFCSWAAGFESPAVSYSEGKFSHDVAY